MYISLHRSGKDKQNVYVRVMESRRDKDGKVTKIVIENLGRLDDLLKDDPDALGKLKAKYAGEREAQKSAVVQQRLTQVAKTLELPEQSEVIDDGFPMLHYGHYAFRKLWKDEFHFDRKINYLRKTDGKKYDVDAALQYLVFHKLMNPCSVLSAFDDKDNFLGDPARNLSLDHFYDTYDFVNDHHDEIFNWVNRQLDRKYGKDRATLVFYDVTNVYFESALTDAEKWVVRSDFLDIVKERAQQLRAKEELRDSCFDEDGNVIAENLPISFWYGISDDKLEYLRMRGPSKEHRFDLPLVSIAMVIDRNGFPMDVCVYSGNSSEFKTMESSIAALKKKYEIGSAIVVADRGLNSLSNLSMLQEKDLGFLMAQKVSNFSESLKKKMLDRTRYTPFNKDHPEAGGYQVIPNWTKTGSSGSPIHCTLVLTYDEKRRRRDEAILAMWVEIVKAKQAAGVKLGPRKNGWAALAKTSGKTEEEIIGIDEAVLAKKKALCGFAAMVYKEPPADDGDAPRAKALTKPTAPLTGKQIASTYRTLNHIETCFRTMKSNLGLRPMYVRLAQHIKAHVDICVLALLFMRTIQQRAEAHGESLSPQRISSVLRDMKVLALRNGPDSLTFLSAAPRSDYRRQHARMETRDIVKLLKSGELKDMTRTTVLQGCGMSPIPRICSRSELARALGTQFPTDETALPEIIDARL